MRKIIIASLLVMLFQTLTGCVPVLIGATAGAAGGYVYSKNNPYSANNQ